MGPEVLIPVAFFVCATTIVVNVLRYKERTRGAPPNTLLQSGETNLRLERIEQAIEAMAVEVERISEGQRFVTRLLAERPAERAALGEGKER